MKMVIFLVQTREWSLRKRGGRSAKGIADPEKQNADLDSRNDNPNDKVLQLEL